MAEMPDYNLTNPSDKQAFQRFIIELMRNEINSYTRQTQNTYASQANYESVATSGVLPGIIVMYGGVTLPSGYLWCDGSVVLKGVYPSLYAAFGANRYGADTATQFTLPDLRSRLPRGTATVAGAVASNSNNTFTLNNTSTSTNSGNHSHTNNAVNISSSGGHSHNVNGGNATANAGNTNRGATGTQAAVASASHTHNNNATTTADFGVHTHTTNQGNTDGQGDHGHSVSAPTLVGGLYVPAFVEVNYIIKI